MVFIIRVTNGSRQFSFAALTDDVAVISDITASIAAISLFFIINILSEGYMYIITQYMNFVKYKRAGNRIM